MSDQTLAASPQGMVGSVAGQREKAGFGKRLWAILIDTVLIWFVSGLIGKAMGQDVFSSTDGVVSLQMTGLPALILMLGPIFYYAFMEGKYGQTLGKKAAGIKVVRADSVEPLGLGKGFVRWLGRIPSSLILGLGYFWMIWDDEKQTWHDKIADTYVVKV